MEKLTDDATCRRPPPETPQSHLGSPFREGAGPLYLQIAQQVREAVDDGVLRRATGRRSATWPSRWAWT
jgi:hypothetical protein